MLKFFKNKKEIVEPPVPIETEEERRAKILDYSYDESRVLYHTSFEDGLGGWYPRTPREGDPLKDRQYSIKLEITTEEAHSGSKCLKVSNRHNHWNGPVLDITKYIKPDVLDYEVMVWVKIPDNFGSCLVRASYQTSDKLVGDFPDYHVWEDYYTEDFSVLSNYWFPVGRTDIPENYEWALNYPKEYVSEDNWVLLRGKAKIDIKKLEYVYFFIETADGKEENQDIYIDDFVLLTGK